MARTKRALSHRAGKEHFRKFVASAEPTADSLPLTHVTDVWTLREIREAEALVPLPCAVFHEPLLYLFYGRPAYRKNLAEQASAVAGYAPVCFIVHPSEGMTCDRVYPFDTGAFEIGLLDPALHHQMIRDDFALDADLVSARKVAQLFFEGSQSYLENGPADPAIPQFQFEAQAYRDLIRKSDKAEIDDRLSAVEVQRKDPIPLKGNVAAVVVPEKYADDPDFMAQMKALGVTVLPYVYVERYRSVEWSGAIVNVVIKYYRDVLKCI